MRFDQQILSIGISSSSPKTDRRAGDPSADDEDRTAGSHVVPELGTSRA